MFKRLACISRFYFDAHRVKGTTCCGHYKLFDTHCYLCRYWIENQADEGYELDTVDSELCEQEKEED